MVRILVAEDNPGDVLLLREALRHSQVACELIVAEDGEKAFQLLEKAASLAQSSRPDLIVLDVNLPKRSGKDVLRWVRSKPELAAIPVVLLTSSASPDDKAEAMLLGANLYVQKSSNLDEVLKLGPTMENLLRDKADKL